jgi:hypothetical protein
VVSLDRFSAIEIAKTDSAVVGNRFGCRRNRFGCRGNRFRLSRKSIRLSRKSIRLSQKPISALAEIDSALAETDSALAEIDSALAEIDSALAKTDFLCYQDSAEEPLGGSTRFSVALRSQRCATRNPDGIAIACVYPIVTVCADST